MDIKKYMAIEGEKPLDNIVPDGGFCSIFRTIGCIGDSLSSGEFESLTSQGDRGFHDFFEYSWGQFMAREAGVKVYNFSRGGMSAQEYMETFAVQKGFWDMDKLCQAYIIALGVNDIFGLGQEIGTTDDIKFGNRNFNTKNFAGYYGKIIQQIKTKQPYAKIFLVSMPKEDNEEKNKKIEEHKNLLADMTKIFDNTYLIDLFTYAPVYDEQFRKNFFLGSHMNAQGYVLTAKMIMSYIDYIIRHNPDDFAQVGFIDKPFYNTEYKR